jgi:hypothetical protein
MQLQFKSSGNIYSLDLPKTLVERSTGELINPNASAIIAQLLDTDTYTLLTSGGHKSSNRWHYNLTLDEAKFKAIKWAKNRYKVKA